MDSLQQLNPQKDTATNSQIMFLVLHTSGLVFIPLSIITYRIAAGSTDATSVFLPCVLGTLATTIASILAVSAWQRRFDPKLMLILAGLVLAIAGFLFGISQLNPEQKSTFSGVAGNAILLVIVVAIVLSGVFKKIAVFDSFIDGAKDGFGVVLKIIPYLVGMLVAIRLFRDSGALTYVTDGIGYLLSLTGINTDFVPALPTAIMKPFSGSGARALMLDAMKVHGPDSFVGQMACTFQGSADTTFYIIALYFGSVGIRKVRYAVWAGLLADFLGVIAAILIAYMFFR
jgi:spore maturation protein SpmB